MILKNVLARILYINTFKFSEKNSYISNRKTINGAILHVVTWLILNHKISVLKSFNSVSKMNIFYILPINYIKYFLMIFKLF